MSREIKFRAWDAKERAMFPIHQLSFSKISNELTWLEGVDIRHKDSDYEGDVAYGGSAIKMTGTPPKPRYILMQYTGLHDRNGEEVYEGDIFDIGGRPKVVEWNDLCAQWAIKSPTGLSYLDLNADLHEYEAIGNIYEHPDLLEGGEHGA